MNSKKWFLFTISVYFCLLILIGVTVVVIDPFFHYHKPIQDISYKLENEQYINDGISKHFQYDAMITGTSTTLFFDTHEIDELFDVTSVRLTFCGEGFKKINDNIRVAATCNPELKLIIRGVDPLWFISNENWLGYDEYPDYLYDDNMLNDINYLYNKDIFFNDLVPIVTDTIKGKPAESFEREYVKGSKAVTLEKYIRPEKEKKDVLQSETDEFFAMLDRNLQVNLISTIEENPNITFYLFFPPYSICWWDSINQYGADVLLRRIDLEKYAIEKILPYSNVQLFSFNNNFDLVNNLNHYIDEVHYDSDTCSDILNWIRNNEYELTEDNYEEYIEMNREFYTNYDYDSIFQ